MSDNRRSKHRLTDEEYRRECTIRNPAFIKDRNHLLELWPVPPSFPPPPQVGLKMDAFKRYEAADRKFRGCLIKLCEQWGVTPGDVTTGIEPIGQAMPKVSIVPFPPGTLPRDGSFLLRVYPATTGEEIKRQWQTIKKKLPLRQRRVRDTKALKLKIYDLHIRDGKTFKQIAKETKKSDASVFSIFILACSDIGHVRDKTQKRTDPRFDVQEHWSTCRQCQAGRLCQLAETKAGLKMPYLREKPIN